MEVRQSPKLSSEGSNPSAPAILLLPLMGCAIMCPCIENKEKQLYWFTYNSCRLCKRKFSKKLIKKRNFLNKLLGYE